MVRRDDDGSLGRDRLDLRHRDHRDRPPGRRLDLAMRARCWGACMIVLVAAAAGCGGGAAVFDDAALDATIADGATASDGAATDAAATDAASDAPTAITDPAPGVDEPGEHTDVG